MEGLIQEILDVSRIKSAGFLVNFSNVSLDNIVRNCIQEWEDVATDRGVTFHNRNRRAHRYSCGQSSFSESNWQFN